MCVTSKSANPCKDGQKNMLMILNGKCSDLARASKNIYIYKLHSLLESLIGTSLFMTNFSSPHETLTLFE